MVLLSVRCSFRQRNCHRCAAAAGVDMDVAVMVCDGALHDGEPEPHAAALAGAER